MFNDEIKMTELEKKISRLEKTAGRGRYNYYRAAKEEKNKDTENKETKKKKEDENTEDGEEPEGSNA